MLTHTGRLSGKIRETVAMVLRYDSTSHEAVICSAWGENADWIRNLRAGPALQVRIGRETFKPEQRFLSEDECMEVIVNFRRKHPWRLRLISAVLGWNDFSSDASTRDFVRTHPFIALRPTS